VTLLGKTIKLLIGLLFIPLDIGLSRALYILLTQVRVGSRLELWFVCGLGAYALLFALGYRLQFLYVFGHESVHALLSMLCGGRVKSFRVSEQSGRVATTKNNFLITLAPYFFPFYTLLLGLGFSTARYFAASLDRITPVLLFLLGMSIAFHLFMTITALATKQPDIIQQGRLFSLTLTYAINIILIALLVSLVFREASFPAFWRDGGIYTMGVYRWLGNILSRLAQKIASGSTRILP